MQKIKSFIKNLFIGRISRKKLLVESLKVIGVVFGALSIIMSLSMASSNAEATYYSSQYSHLYGGLPNPSHEKGSEAMVIFYQLLLLGVSILMIPLTISASVYSFSLYARRLHDLDKTGWFSLLHFVPFLNLILFIYLYFTKGTTGPNQFGEDPLSDLDISSPVTE